MKRCLTVSAICLILTVVLGGELSARNTPYYPERITIAGPGGDDHPWGGDEMARGGNTNIRTRTGATAAEISSRRFLEYFAMRLNLGFIFSRGTTITNQRPNTPEPPTESQPDSRGAF